MTEHGTFVHESRRVAYRARGAGPLLVVVPGSTAASAHHEPEIAHFAARGFRAAAIDLPGTGRSDRIARWPDAWWDLGAAAVLGLVDVLSPDAPAVLVGTSGGAVVALLAAAAAPERVRAVVADSAVPRYDPEVLRRAVLIRRMELPGAGEWWRAAHGDDWRAVVEADSDFIERLGSAGGDPFRGRLAAVRCPVLFTGSLGDELLKTLGDGVLELLRAIPGSRSFLVREGRHPMIWTRARAFRGAADAFLDEVVRLAPGDLEAGTPDPRRPEPGLPDPARSEPRTAT